MAKLNNQKAEETAVVLENVQFRRATIVPRDAPVRFLVNVLDGTGEFDVCEGGAVVVTGSARLAPDPAAERLQGLDEPEPEPEPQRSDELLPLVTDDIYKELRLRGYNYGGVFRGIRESDAVGAVGALAWDGNWIPFMDTMLQFGIIGVDTRELYLPTRLQRALIDPRAQPPPGEPVRVRMHRHLDVIAAGGVELRGVKTSLAPRRANAQPDPKLEKYVFVPYDADADPKEDARSRKDALVISLQLLLENVGSLRLKVSPPPAPGSPRLSRAAAASTARVLQVCEAALGRAAEALLLPDALAALDAEPQVRVDAVLATDNAAQYQQLQTDLGFKVNFLREGIGTLDRLLAFVYSKKYILIIPLTFQLGNSN